MAQTPPAPTSANISDMTALFVRRPVLAIVVNLLILVGGLAALSGVAIRELPEVDSPTISISTSYSGASSETMDQEVTSVIESAAAQVSGVKSMSSSSSYEESRVTVEFTTSTDLEVATSDMRDQISRIGNNLPDEIDGDPTVVKADADSQPIMRLAVTSETMEIDALTDMVEDEIIDHFAAVEGVADISVFGDREQTFLIDIDQTQLATRGLTIADLADALDDVALDVPAGSLESNAQDFTIRAAAGLQTTEEFERLIIADNVRLADVAVVSLGPDTGSSVLRANGQTGIGLGIVRQAGSNTLSISNDVHAVVEDMRDGLPDGVEIDVTSDDATFINGAILEVLKSLGLAIVIVVAVIYIFLLNIRATLIPALTLPVALIGTVGGIWLAGFSINIITLLALVLATGMVVDDAIVVLENIVKKRDAGMPPRAAAVRGTREVFFAVITTTATLAAVFVPLSFLPGTSGGLFREFGYVLAIAVTISSFVALSLCPMLASRLLTEKPVDDETAKPGPMMRLGGAFSRFYAAILRACLAAPLVVLTAAAMFATAAWITYGTLDEELTPPEDRAVALLRINAPEGVSLAYTESKQNQIEALLQPFRESGEVEYIFSIAGRGASNEGFMVMTLAPWDERTRSQDEIVNEMNRVISSVIGVRAFVIQPNSLGIRGAGSGLRMAITGNDYGELADAANALKTELENDPEMGRIQLSYETTQPQIFINIDRERADDLGIDITGLSGAMQALLDGNEVSEVFVDGDAIPVKLISTTNQIDDPTDLENIFLMASDGRFVPMSSIVTIEEMAVAPSLDREEQLRAIVITAELSDGLALRDGIERLQTAAEPILSSDSGLIPLSEAATLDETSSGLGMVFGFAIVIVILVLAAQFESFLSSLIIVGTVPLGLACAVFALAFTGISLNVYSQIGLVLLVGIMAKNGILIVEFANQLRDQGLSVGDAAEQAALQRLRPVMMTMISTVLGGVPLVLSTGAGAEARVSLGWVIVGGLGLATLATLFVTPVVYKLLAGFSKPQVEELRRLEAEMAA
ncbi:efflux RND transporter permease subunit [Octadecabacter sp. G9-8]|uniref:Efflux RND transporter permease subunit n=1 Tax=Octadecabacter dasysiphoniae TaxID=2909341 RepID=A0ABS9CWI1_9RHOB|nr:efflux RND transporter permease subunit [Octadecabacter dasysiphoniae]MCF2870749.1 efflux RND transporter permease subunit [Octadecabacter dasysiphoniae]